MLGVERTGEFLPGVENMGLSVIGDKKILSVRYKGEKITKTFEFSDDDTWVSLEIDGTEYDVNIWETDPNVWNASINGLEEVEDGEGVTREQLDTNVFVAIYQAVHPESFSIIDKCDYIPQKAVTSIEECEEMNNLYEAVIDQVKEDLASNDTTAIEELLSFVPKENLIGYLPE